MSGFNKTATQFNKFRKIALKKNVDSVITYIECAIQMRFKFTWK